MIKTRTTCAFKQAILVVRFASLTNWEKTALNSTNAAMFFATSA